MGSRIQIFSIVSLLIFGCAKESSRHASISGTVEGGGIGEQLYLEQLKSNDIAVLDTAIIEEDGSFSFDHNIRSIGFYRIKQSDKKFMTIIADSSDTVKVQANWEIGITPYQISGSYETDRLIQLNRKAAVIHRKRDSLNQVFQGNQGNRELLDQLQDEFAFHTKRHTEFVKKFINEDPGSFANLAAAEQLNPETEFDYYEKIDQAMKELYGETKYYQEFHKMVDHYGQLAVGSVAPDILLPNPDGDVVPLSSLRGKVVLVDFWASWCKPCRMENPNVVKAHERFKDKGFTVYGVSLDRNRQEWLQAIQQDNLHWTQVSDLKFWNSSVVKLYDIQGIPFALLLDREGKIIAKNLRGEALNRKLEEILN